MKNVYTSRCKNCHSYCQNLGGPIWRKITMWEYNLTIWPHPPEKSYCKKYIPSDNLEYLESLCR